MSRRVRSANQSCPRCETSQPVPLSAVGHECERCFWEWRFAICGTCDTLACTLEYLESWRCLSCQTFNRSWWKTADADADRAGAAVAERRRIQNARHTGRWVAAGVVGVALVVGSFWAVAPRQPAEERERAAAQSTCRRFDQIRRDEASGALSRVALLRETEALTTDATKASADVRDGAGKLAAAAAAGTDSPRFPAAMTALTDACRAAVPQE